MIGISRSLCAVSWLRGPPLIFEATGLIHQFVAAFAGTLIHEERDWGPYPVTTRQAYERAKRSDDFWDGAAGFLLFEKD